MDSNLGFEKYIKAVLSFEKSGNKELALQMLDMLDKAYPDQENVLLKLRARVIMDDGRKLALIEKYKEERRLLEKQGLVFGEFPEEPGWLVISSNSEMVTAINLETDDLRTIRYTEVPIDESSVKGKAVYVEGAFFEDQIKKIARAVELNEDFHLSLIHI